jgi:oxygen-independent coproporphyrinogen-3 oxidase
VIKKIGLFGTQDFSGAQHIVRVFFPGCQITYEEEAELCIWCQTEEEDDTFTCHVRLQDDAGRTETAKEQILKPYEGKKKQSCLYRAIFTVLSQYTGRKPPWGILIGVRPVKLLQNMLGEGWSKAQVEEILSKEYLVSQEKIGLLFTILEVQQPIMGSFLKNNYSLYISIPFCPTKCSYCSFVSHSVEGAGHLIGPYLEKLSEELCQLGQLAKENDLCLDSIYIGGGTPTILTPLQLDGLLDTVASHFPVKISREYTVEAGRPDTIDEEKLWIMRKRGVNRISINPQTMNDETLRLIGRRHSAKETVKAFYMARRVGFDNINMDLIAGLPQESCEMFANTLDKVLELDPESLTVHTLSMKRGSKLSQGSHNMDQEPIAAHMLTHLEKRIKQTSYLPYYLYRQKNMKDSLENTGYCKEGKECIYNIAAMEEAETILAAGAGAVTKIVCQKSGKIDRIFNFKFPYEYNRQIDSTTAVSSLKSFFSKGQME